MKEPKTFGELSINDCLYTKCKDNGNTHMSTVTALKPSEHEKNHIQVTDDSGDPTDLPCDETFLEDDDCIFSTNKDDYSRWQIPRWQKEIDAKTMRIAEIKDEIRELEGKIMSVK